VTTPKELREEEARAQRAREIRDGVLNDTDLMEQVRKSAAPNARRIPWRELQAKLRACD
jgi:hypothetical protein